jgi:glycosyltransferase involved in cell wall biosynthesis
MAHLPSKFPITLSIGIMAWNEEDSICTTLESLFRQSVFQRLCARHEQCEIVVVANGCTDRTVPVARDFLENMSRTHDWREAFSARVVDVPEPGKCNAWNRFVHEFSSLQTKYLCLMDADIVFHHRDTIFNLMAALETRAQASAASGRQCKDILFKPRKTLRDRISLATSSLSGGAGMICGQLYCLRASVARNLHLPRGLGAVEDGFIKAAVCTDFFTRDSSTWRVASVADAAHIFEAYVSLRDVLNNQKRQMIGQATVHVLVKHLQTLSLDERHALGETLRRLEARDPDWLPKLMNEHIRETRFFWRLFPGALTFRFRRLWKMPGARKLTHLPATLAGFFVTCIACWRAHRVLSGGVTHYWPKAARQTILSVPQLGAK